MSLNREQHYTGETIELMVRGQPITGEVWYDSSSGKVQVRRQNNTKGIIYDDGVVMPGQPFSKNNIEELIKNNSKLKNLMTQGGVRSTPGFLTEGGVIGREQDLTSNSIKDLFTTTDNDKYFVVQGGAG